jgi:hypothetical protein
MQLTICIFLPMYHFVYFVGKMTHRPGDHRQNEPTSKFERMRHAELECLRVNLPTSTGQYNICCISIINCLQVLMIDGRCS